MKCLCVVVGVTLLSALIGCSTAVTCLPMKNYTVEEQKNLEETLKTLPPESPLIGMALDYLKTRDMIRACQESQ